MPIGVKIQLNALKIFSKLNERAASEKFSLPMFSTLSPVQADDALAAFHSDIFDVRNARERTSVDGKNTKLRVVMNENS